jgi:hypothetical protein
MRKNVLKMNLCPPSRGGRLRSANLSRDDPRECPNSISDAKFPETPRLFLAAPPRLRPVVSPLQPSYERINDVGSQHYCCGISLILGSTYAQIKGKAWRIIIRRVQAFGHIHNSDRPAAGGVGLCDPQFHASACAVIVGIPTLIQDAGRWR